MILCLMGPTACGKTEAAIRLAEHYPCEIISVDSAMVYRGLDIGTAKPTPAECARAPHRLIDIRDPAEPYSVGEFCRDAWREIDSIRAAGRTPLLVGGTMMYFHQLQSGYSALPASTAETRAAIAAEAEYQGWPALYDRLKQIDPEMALTLHPNDTQRIARALELYAQTGQTMTQWQAEQTQNKKTDFVHLILAPPERQIIHDRIAKRFDQMLGMGFLNEVEGLFHRGDLYPELPAIRSVGYRQAWSYFEGEYDHATMREKAIVATRQLCKRQFTWLRRFSDATWHETPKAILAALGAYF